MTTKREYRFNPAQELRVQTDANGNRTLTGYAAVFSSLSQDLGGWKEQIEPGAFTRSLAGNPDVLALSEHDPKKGLLGRTKSGTLRLAEDNVGLRFDVDLPNTTLGNDVATSVARGDLDGCSFGFIANETDWTETPDGIVRSLISVDVFDVTVTSQPAYLATSVSLRSRMFPDGDVTIPAELRCENKEQMRDICQCPCPECQAGDCGNCSMDGCMDMNCACQQERCNKLLASVIERRIR